MISVVIGLTMDNIWNFRLDNGGITVLNLNNETCGQLIVLNQNNHLKKYIADIDSQAL
jgi:broad specificity phosphatase PhoE